MLIWRRTHMCTGWTEVVVDDSKKSMKREVNYNTCCFFALSHRGRRRLLKYFNMMVLSFANVRYVYFFHLLCFSFYHHEFVLIVESDIVWLRGFFCVRAKKLVINATRSCSDYRRRNMILSILLTKLSTLKRCTGCNKIISTVLKKSKKKKT